MIGEGEQYFFGMMVAWMVGWIIIQFKFTEGELIMNFKNVRSQANQATFPSLLPKSKSSSILQLKPSKSLLPCTLTSLELRSPRETLNGEQSTSKHSIIQYGELPIQSEITPSNCFFEYYPPESQILSKRVSFASEKPPLIEPPGHPSHKKRTASILKKGSLTKKSRSSSNASIRLNSSIERDPKHAQADQINLSVLNKFKNLLADFETKRAKAKSSKNSQLQEKFTDCMFPPIYSSLFAIQKSNCTGKKRIGSEIVWKRLPEVFKSKRTILKKTPGEESNVSIGVGKYCSSYFAQTLTAIKECDALLNEFLSDHISNDFGVYCIKIFSENGWRHVIIDDFIPVIKEGDKDEWTPAFVNISPSSKSSYRTRPLEIWPLLLEKAYASYYSTYEAMKYGKVDDFLEELTGSMFVATDIKTQAKHNQCIYLQQYAEEATKQNEQTQPVPFLKSLEFKRVNYKMSKISPPKQIAKNLRPDIFLRKITVATQSELKIMVRQKDERFYHHSAVFYSYIWNRVIILYKQYDSSYSWVDGAYSNSKSINFAINAKPGEYYLLLLPEWHTLHRHQLSLLVCSEKEGVDLQTFPYEDGEKILEKGCSDLAQRMGTLEQINKITCSYQYVHAQCGLIIESIHNERISGEIVIQREWKPCCKWLVPFNSEFLQSRRKVEVLIEKNSQFTLVILETNGRRNDLLKYQF